MGYICDTCTKYLGTYCVSQKVCWIMYIDFARPTQFGMLPQTVSITSVMTVHKMIYLYQHTDTRDDMIVHQPVYCSLIPNAYAHIMYKQLV